MTVATIAYFGISDQGNVRFRNEDFIIDHQPEDVEVRQRKGSLFAVCDGVGGAGAGEVASREAAEALVKHYYSNKRSPERALRDAFGRANLHVYDLHYTRPSASNMQTTVSALVLCGANPHLGHVGDSRIYRFRPQTPGVGDSDDVSLEVKQLSTDHSEVAELVRMQIIGADMLRKHPRRNIITRSLGGEPVVRPQFLTLPLERGDIFLICSDGLWEPLEEREMVVIIERNDIEAACRQLVARALERGVTDNISAQLIKVAELPTADETGADARARNRPSFLERLFRRQSSKAV